MPKWALQWAPLAISSRRTLFSFNWLIIFSNLRETRVIKELLEYNCETSGQLINLHKLVVYFSKGSYNRRCEALARVLGMRQMENDVKYLGNPLIMKRNKHLSFECWFNKIRNRIAGLAHGRFLYSFKQGEMTHLPNLLPRHPSKITETIDKMIRRFWRGENEGKKKINTIKQKELCKPIGEGGFGIRDSKSNNLALLAKNTLEVPRW